MKEGVSFVSWQVEICPQPKYNRSVKIRPGTMSIPGIPGLANSLHKHVILIEVDATLCKVGALRRP